jgi:GT2 family glycosyltransferase
VRRARTDKQGQGELQVLSDQIAPTAGVPEDRPVLTVLTVHGEHAAMRGTYDSLSRQTDRRWEWVVAGAPGGDARAAVGLPLDPRVVSAGEGEASERGWADRLAAAFGLATGEHVMVVRAGDELAEGAVEAVAEFLPPGTWGYTDEEQRFPSGRTPDVWAKPDFSPELLRSQPYAVRSAVLPRDELARIGGIRPHTRTAAWYDAVLRMSEADDAPRHLARPHVIRTDPRMSRRFVDGDPADHVRAVGEHCARSGIPVDDISPVVVRGCVVGQRVHRSVGQPSVSVVIPTRGGASVIHGRLRRHVVELVRSLWVAERYPDLELVVVYDTDTPDEVLDELRALVGDSLVLQPWDSWFHFSRKCNAGAVAARGEYVCFLNDDMEIIAPDWLSEMVGRLDDPGVGAVGARLLFAEGTLQHIGHEYAGGGAGHPLFGWRASTLHLGAAAHVAGERSGVTAACLLVRREEFLRLGGFSDVFPGNYNDVDFCLKVRESGRRIVYTPHAELFHFESQSRTPRILESEQLMLRARWPVRMRRDPYIRYTRPLLPRRHSTNPVTVGPEAADAAASPVTGSPPPHRGDT